jgi:hypothetical protein
MKLDNDKPASIQKIESDASKKAPLTIPNPPQQAAPVVKPVTEVKPAQSPPRENAAKTSITAKYESTEDGTDKLTSHKISLLGDD